jgi:4-hydroxybenzoate polyprenyltransferase
LHQWSKNSLIFVPLILGGKLGSAEAWLSCLCAFLAIGIVASSTYLLNDLLDLESDRAHWTKRNRALASGRISIFTGLMLAPLGILLGLALGYWACGPFALLFLAVYLGVTIAYSLRLKRIPILDAAILATLFTLRLALGMVSADVRWSPWLLVFSMFIFGSLSLAKRLTEIIGLKGRSGHELGGRGYVVADEPLVMALGVSLSSASIFVIIEEAFQADFYRAPVFLWALPVILIIWLGRIWLLCGRGQLHDDPVVFAAKDKVSLSFGGLILLSIFAAVAL